MLLVGARILRRLEQGPVLSLITPGQCWSYLCFALQSGKPGNITEHRSPLDVTSLKQFLYQDKTNGCVTQPIRKQQGKARPLLLILRFRKHALKQFSRKGFIFNSWGLFITAVKFVKRKMLMSGRAVFFQHLRKIVSGKNIYIMKQFVWLLSRALVLNSWSWW